jgi:RimJ/RimL family protein N-acetyltransferase
MISPPLRDRLELVKTTLPTLPMPSTIERKHIATDRLILRPVVPEDAKKIYVMKSQYEVMRWSSTGKIDKDENETLEKLQMYFPPHDTEYFQCSICLKSNGELIGLGGCHSRLGDTGWPVVGYMFQKEFWGLGYGTEFLKAFIDAWWKLPRSPCEIEVERSTIRKNEAGEVLEVYTAIIAAHNGASRRVLEKCGFEDMTDWMLENNCPDSEDVKLVALGLTKSAHLETIGQGA